MSDQKETYLGDGVYVSFDGSYFWLRTHRENGGDHMIALEPGMLEHLRQYAEVVYARIRQGIPP